MSSLICLSCGSQALEIVLSLGKQPLANALLTEEQLSEPEQRYPLDLAFCSACALAQITEVVSPEILFGEYNYFSSFSSTMVAHAKELADRLIVERQLGPGSLAMEVASNDGYLLQNYVAAGIPVLGIEPARNVAPAAEAKGVTTLCEFFSPSVADRLVADGQRADVLHANNVMAHVPDINGIMSGIARVLKPTGVAVIETPYVRDLVERLEFDTIYHEHLFYYSLTSLERVARRNGLSVVGVERLPIHGGSLRVFASPSPAEAGPAVDAMLEEEARLGMGTVGYFRGFAARVDMVCRSLVALVGSLKAEGRRLAAYGAAAKGSTLLNACGLGTETFEYVADRSTHKQGRYMPGVHLPIVSAERLLADGPDDVLLCTWNFADEILAQQAEFRARGGRFIIPVPEPRVV
ncbi:MAG TPA: class I SAM-dependent methyltransferase [Actinomycetota bacterium]|nr:class I SAM-dependent methyltransferase [Actinomycetota bacterium]